MMGEPSGDARLPSLVDVGVRVGVVGIGRCMGVIVWQRSLKAGRVMRSAGFTLSNCIHTFVYKFSVYIILVGIQVYIHSNI